MTEQPERVTVGTRLASMFVDHIFMTVVMVVVAAPGMFISALSNFSSMLEVSHEPLSTNFGSMPFWLLLGYSLYLNKDVFNGRSGAKRLMKLQVVHHKTGVPASPLRCFVRNITVFVWPLEVLMTLINPQRRLGDRIAGTRVTYVEQPEKVATNWKKVGLALGVGLGVSGLIVAPFFLMVPGPNFTLIDYVQSSYDEPASEAANTAFENQLEELIKEADFRIYNQIEDDDRKYVSGILYFHYQDDYEEFTTAEEQIKALVLEQFPLEEHLCFIKFVYQEPGSLSTRQKWYDILRAEE